MHLRFVRLVLSILLLAPMLPVVAQDDGGQSGGPSNVAIHELPQPLRVHNFDKVFQTGENWPDFANGYLIDWTPINAVEETANVALWNSDGTIERSDRVWLDGAKKMDLSHVAATATGEVVAGGYAVLERGAVAHFVAKTDPNGGIIGVVHITPFVPLIVCAAPDGTVWSMGRDLGKDEASEDYAILRQYRFASGQVRELVRRRSFGSGESPVRGRRSAFLRCREDRVVAYVNKTHELFEIVDSGETVRRFRVEPPQFGMKRLESLALLGDGSVFAGIRGRGEEPRRICELQKDEQQRTASWVPVPGAGQSPEEAFLNPPYGFLFGSDGDNLVLTIKGGGLAWVKPQIRQQ